MPYVESGACKRGCTEIIAIPNNIAALLPA